MGIGINTPAAADTHIDSVSIEEKRELMHQPVFDSIAEHPSRILTPGHGRIANPHTAVPHLHLGEVIFLLGIIEVETMTGRTNPCAGLAFDTLL